MPVPVIETDGDPQGVAIRAVEVGDFNGDGLPDIAAVTDRIEVRDPPNGPIIGTAPANLVVAINNGNGQFFNPISIPAFSADLTDLVVGDFNGDDYLDAAACAEFSGSPSQDVIVFWGTMFGLPIDVRSYAGPDESTSISAADINADTMTDLLVSDKSGGGRIWMLLNRGGQQFETQSINVNATGGSGRSVTRALAMDIDGDTKLDIVASSPRADTIFSWKNLGGLPDGPVMLGVRESRIVTPGCDWIEAGGLGESGIEPDLDANGIPDLIVFNEAESEVRIYSGEGTGGFCLLETLAVTEPQRGVMANIEGDGSDDDDVDVVIAADTPVFGTVVVVSNGGDRNCDAIDGDDTPDDLQDFMGIATWNFADDGSFHDENSWCPIEVPASDQKLLFKRDGMYRVEIGRDCGTPLCNQYAAKRLTVSAGFPIFDTLPQTSPTLTIGDGLVEGDLDGRETVIDGDLTIGTESGVPSMLELTSGVFVVGTTPDRRDTLHIGEEDGSNGSVFLSEDDAVLDASDATVVIGTGGRGYLSVSRGEFSAGELELGTDGEPREEGGTLVIEEDGLANIDSCNIFESGELRMLGNGSIFNFGTLFVLGGRITGDLSENTLGIRPNTINRGLVAPGTEADPIGRLKFRDFEQRVGPNESSGRLEIDVMGAGSNEYDILEATSDVILGGSLIVREIGDLDDIGADPDPIRFLEADNVEGQFDVALLPGLRDGRFFKLVYNREGSGQQGVALELSSLGNEFGFDDTIDPDLDAVGGPVAVQLADMDGDAELDVVVVLSGDADAPQPVPGALLVLINAGFDDNGEWAGFETAINRPVGFGPTALAIGDLDGDQTNDIAVTHSNDGSDEVRIGLNADNDGDVTFFPNQIFVADPTAIVIADFDEDGGNDIAVAGVDAMGLGSLAIRLNTNTTIGDNWQGLEPTVRAFTSGGGTTFMDVGDFDNDTCIDIFLTSDGDGGINIFPNEGIDQNGDWIGLGTRVMRATGPNPSSAFIADLNLDSDQAPGELANRNDIIVVDRELNQLTVLLNTNTASGAVQFSAPANIPFGDAPIAVSAGDYDGDGDPDVATIVVDSVTAERSLRLLRNDLDPGTGQVQFADDDLGVDQPANPVLLASGDVSLDANEDLVAITGDLPAPGLPRGGAPSFVRPFFISPQPTQCNQADLAEPFGVLDLQDIAVFVTGFQGNDPIVDFDENGIFDLADISIFVSGFSAGCP